MISCGVALASKGELKFDLIGFVTQAAAVAVSRISWGICAFARYSQRNSLRPRAWS